MLATRTSQNCHRCRYTNLLYRVFNAKMVPLMHGLSCTLNTSSFTVDVVATKDDCDSILKNEQPIINQSIDHQPTEKTSNGSSVNLSRDSSCLRISVFQQIPGTLLVKGSLQDRNCLLSGAFSVIFQKLEEALRSKFCTKSVKGF